MRSNELCESDDLKKTEDTWLLIQYGHYYAIYKFILPSAAICSLVRTGWNPTKGTCILARVPTAYHEEYAT